MGFLSYNVSGFRYFLILALPVLVFLIFYVYCRINHGDHPEKNHAYYLTSQVLIVYVFVFFSYLFFGLRFLNLLGR
ncbi:MAG: hypothetical protein H8D54_01565 [Candidatus Omnitrophica bacterium]|nr:hypothetical protein [Candidatus Omnitrophota bacterium]